MVPLDVCPWQLEKRLLPDNAELVVTTQGLDQRTFPDLRQSAVDKRRSHQTRAREETSRPRARAEASAHNSSR